MADSIDMNEFNVPPTAEELREAEALESFIAGLQRGEHPVTPSGSEVSAAARLAEQWYVAGIPDAAFVTELRGRLLHELPPSTTQEMPAVPPSRPKRNATRRGLIQGGLAAAAGVAAGVLIDRATSNPSSPSGWKTGLVGGASAWLAVVKLDDLLPGNVISFATPQVVGNVVRRLDGSLLALSAACTHMGCLLAWNTSARTFDCPCHNGRFDSEGRFYSGVVPYQPLPQLQTKVENGIVSVLVPVPAGVTAPAHTATPSNSTTPEISPTNTPASSSYHDPG